MVIQWELCKIFKFNHSTKWYMNNPESVLEKIIIIMMSRHQHGYPWPFPYCQVFRVTSCIGTELLYVGSSLSFCLCSSIWRGPQDFISYELVLNSPAGSRMSGSSNFDSFRDGQLVAVQLLLCGLLLPELVQYCSQHSGVVAVKLFLHTFS